MEKTEMTEKKVNVVQRRSWLVARRGGVRTICMMDFSIYNFIVLLKTLDSGTSRHLEKARGKYFNQVLKGSSKLFPSAGQEKNVMSPKNSELALSFKADELKRKGVPHLHVAADFQGLNQLLAAANFFPLPTEMCLIIPQLRACLDAEIWQQLLSFKSWLDY
ncbi:hypothetical protein D8674_024241 [Pyrus ussuriensis x Pyrus communis]|uniref:Uncharacterized protein n=1 Tax=Pyrus ussuriensis x Pyrus communis TaxID=2448454 RepID=A0A5N5H2C6_9ROSA|nr:hypothetical protein D8674_024241 [Pyrus ussuriensis x Pyrus communis]